MYKFWKIHSEKGILYHDQTCVFLGRRVIAAGASKNSDLSTCIEAAHVDGGAALAAVELIKTFANKFIRSGGVYSG